jgi:hypothetical protein
MHPTVSESFGFSPYGVDRLAPVGRRHSSISMCQAGALTDEQTAYSIDNERRGPPRRSCATGRQLLVGAPGGRSGALQRRPKALEVKRPEPHRSPRTSESLAAISPPLREQGT